MSWEVFFPTVTNSSSKLTLDDTADMVLFEELKRKYMGLPVEDTTKAHYPEEAMITGRD